MCFLPQFFWIPYIYKINNQTQKKYVESKNNARLFQENFVFFLFGISYKNRWRDLHNNIDFVS